jgi:hypothetical protein
MEHSTSPGPGTSHAEQHVECQQQRAGAPAARTHTPASEPTLLLPAALQQVGPTSCCGISCGSGKKQAEHPCMQAGCPCMHCCNVAGSRAPQQLLRASSSPCIYSRSRSLCPCKPSSACQPGAAMRSNIAISHTSTSHRTTAPLSPLSPLPCPCCSPPQELRAVLPSSTAEGMLPLAWGNLTHALGGSFCASLNFLSRPGRWVSAKA